MRDGPARVRPGAAPQAVVLDPDAIPEPDDDAMTSAACRTPKLHGVILGYSLAHFRFRNDKGEVVEEVALKPGDDVTHHHRRRRRDRSRSGARSSSPTTSRPR